mmetsp:Transcript_59145/g.157108  ORF Transcript_59145/g.157108 Transcript_59145/m.157108 type:complete len:214 (-) Transcript_59145:1066-1707(-)
MILLQDEMQRAKQTLQENKRLEDERRISDQRVSPSLLSSLSGANFCAQAAENEERRMAQFAEEKERKMRLRAEREAGTDVFSLFLLYIVYCFHIFVPCRGCCAQSSNSTEDGRPSGVFPLECLHFSFLRHCFVQVAHLMALRKNENERIAGQVGGSLPFSKISIYQVCQVREAEEKRDAEISAKNERLRQVLWQTLGHNGADMGCCRSLKRSD